MSISLILSAESNDETPLFKTIADLMERGCPVLVVTQKPWNGPLIPLKNPLHFYMLNFVYPQNLNHYIAALLFKAPHSAVIVDYFYKEISSTQFTKILSTSSELAFSNPPEYPVILRCRGPIFNDMDINHLKRWTNNVQIY
nr:uncharacterized protein LOC121115696 [Lepeophtheirus salmonis]